MLSDVPDLLRTMSIDLNSMGRDELTEFFFDKLNARYCKGGDERLDPKNRKGFDLYMPEKADMLRFVKSFLTFGCLKLHQLHSRLLPIARAPPKQQEAQSKLRVEICALLSYALQHPDICTIKDISGELLVVHLPLSAVSVTSRWSPANNLASWQPPADLKLIYRSCAAQFSTGMLDVEIGTGGIPANTSVTQKDFRKIIRSPAQIEHLQQLLELSVQEKDPRLLVFNSLHTPHMQHFLRSQPARMKSLLAAAAVAFEDRDELYNAAASHFQVAEILETTALEASPDVDTTAAGRSNLSLAIRHYEHAVRLMSDAQASAVDEPLCYDWDRSLASMHNALGVACRRGGYFDKARQQYDAALALLKPVDADYVRDNIIHLQQAQEAVDSGASLTDVLASLEKEIDYLPSKDLNWRDIVASGQTDHCAFCRKEGRFKTMKFCSGCNKLQYCSSACQKQDWKTHKQMCVWE
jgi:tetratricopeptide (TPR) repeat protein